MSEQQLEAPPPYSSDSTLQLPAVPSEEPGSSKTKTPSPRMSSTSGSPVTNTPQYLRDLHHEMQSAHLSSSSLATQLELNTRALELPAAPSHAPGSTIGVSTAERSGPSRSSISLDDPDDRMAAEALCGLVQAGSQTSRRDVTSNSPEFNEMPSPDFKRPFSGYETPLQYYPMSIEHTRPGTNSEQQQEPLLSLLTSAHPWLGGTLNGSLSAYSSTKSFSPRFVQYGADLVENTVGTVGRVSGVEGSIRRYLESRDDGVRGRKEVQAPEEHFPAERRKASGASSVDTLPLYDENRSPAYEEAGVRSGSLLTLAQRPRMARSWSTQLMISTSGLGAALNEASLRSLKFCLSILSRANSHVRDLMAALKQVLDEYCQAAPPAASSSAQASGKSGDAMDVDQEEPPIRPGAKVIAQRIRQINNEIWNTIKTVVNMVSKYTGGALPENASVIVRWQLMSVPQRWRRATVRAAPVNEEAGEPAQEQEPVSSAKRMLAFGVEGLEMMDQVAGVVDSTISSAERWLDSMGRRPGGEA